MHPRKQKILFVGEAVTLAHVARPYTLAAALPAADYDIHLAAAPRFEHLYQSRDIHYHPLLTKSSADFLHAVDNGKPLYRSEEYLAYVEGELRLIQDLDPDLIVGDFRHSLGISATLAGKPLINLINAYWSPCRQPAPLPVPELAKLNLHRLPLMPRLMRWITPLAIRLLVAPLNRARAHYGLAPFANCFDAWSHGDQVLYYDAPELVPLSPLPAHHHYLGPVTWSPGGALPDWWPQLQDRPTVYLSLGSSGNLTLLPMLIDQLLGEGLQVIASSGGRQRLPQRPGLFCADFLPGEAAAARADLVIGNGGSPTSYQALQQGTPVIGIPSNMDQLLAMRHIEAYGAGAMLRRSQVEAGQLPPLLRRMLATPSYRQRAEQLARHFAACQPHATFRQVLQQFDTQSARPAKPATKRERIMP
ncbi:glycosyltransferase [Chromobacterium aquaticum]|uniref:Glycosyltransferase n=1 Tax=Chromobacterium aquaticum TaxID=467180 RepID=A0ABV8ZTU4_9NEIS|nr:nucleotide disphospho-sugar-binding domain-containing protein [Chromobacterium aquaticum]MCD5364385.1 glycosyl transferase family 1 [Chromobacterium aquaticum]